MEFSGNLSSISLAEVFQTLAYSGKQGTLAIKEPAGRRCVFFDGPQIRLLSAGKYKAVPIGQMLVENGILDSERLAQFQNSIEVDGKSLEDLLIEADLISAEQVDGLKAGFAEEQIYDLFLMEDAEFNFLEGEPSKMLVGLNDPAVTEMSFDVNPIMMEGVRRIDEWGIFKESIPSFVTVFERAGEPDAGGELPLHADKVLAHVNGTNNVTDIINNLSLPRYAVIETLHALKQSGAIADLSADALTDRAQAAIDSGKWETGVRLLQKASKNNPTDTNLRKKLAETMAENNVERGAAEEYRRLADLYLAEGNKSEALLAVKQVLKRTPDDKGLFEQSIQLQLELGYNDSSHESLMERADALISDHDYDGAQRLLEKFADHFPKDLDFHLKLGTAFAKKGNRSSATKSFLKVIEHLPEIPQRRLDICREILKAQSDMAEARDIVDDLEKQLEKEEKPQVDPARIKRLVAIFGAVLLLGLLYFGWGHFSASSAYTDVEDLVNRALAEEDFLTADRVIKEFQVDHSGAWFVVGQADELRARVNREKKTYFDQKRKLEQQHRQELKDLVAAAKEQTDSGDVDAAKASTDELEQKAKEYGLGTFLAEVPGLREKIEKKAQELARIGARQERIETREKLVQAMLRAGAQIDSGDIDGGMELYRSLLADAKREAFVDKIEEIEKEIRHWDTYIEESILLLDEVELLEQQSKWRQAVDAIALLKAEYPKSRAAQDVRYPFHIDVRPGKAEVYVDGRHIGSGSQTFRYSDDVSSLKILVEANGYRPEQRTADKLAKGYISFRLQKLPEWRYSTDGPVRVAPYLHEGIVFLPAADGSVFAISEDRGTRYWQEVLESGKPFRSNPFGVGNRVYFAGSNGHVYAMDLSESGGTIVWDVDLTSPVDAAIAGTVDTLYVVGQDRILRALKAEDGSEIWQQTIAADCPGGPVLSGETLYLGLTNGSLEARSAADGAVTWERTLSGGIQSRVTVSGDSLVVGTDGGLVHFLATNGDQRQQVRVQGRVRSQVAVAGNGVYVGTDTGTFNRVNPKTGAIDWRFQADEAVFSDPVVHGEYVYFGSDDKTIYALHTESGDPEWTISTEDKIRGPFQVSDTLLLVGSEDRKLYAIPLD